MESKRGEFYAWQRLGLFVAFIFVAVLATSSITHANLGDVLDQFEPTPSGNGRAVAFDPATGHLFYTIIPDTNIYVVDTSNTPVATLSPGIQFGALSWDAKRGKLWGGSYDGSGNVYTIDSGTGATNLEFTFSFPSGDSCYGDETGFIDGLAYDEGPTAADTDDSLWLSDDAARTLFHVDLTGGQIGSFTVPDGRCNTGLAADGQYLWLAVQSGPDTGPHDVFRVAKTDPTVVLSSFNFSNTDIPGPEGIALDLATFAPDHCALWSNQFGSPNLLTAWELEQGIKPECPMVATIDIKPGSFPNSINLKNKGVIPVAILGSSTFDVTQVNYATVCFADDCTEAHGKVHFEDVNGDGFTDAVLHYETQETNIQSGDVEACLTGQLNNLLYFNGCDSVRTVPQ